MVDTKKGKDALNDVAVHAFFFISKTFINNTRLKLAKNQEKAKQHPEAKLLLFENNTLSSFMLSSKTNMSYSKKCAKNRCVCFNEIVRLIIMTMTLKIKNESHGYDTKRIRPSMDTNILNIKCLR